MNGPVAVRTENGEILKSRSDRLCRLRQRPPVVNLANVSRQARINTGYYKPAGLARQLSVWATHRISLRSREGRIALPPNVKEQPWVPFDRR